MNPKVRALRRAAEALRGAADAWEGQAADGWVEICVPPDIDDLSLPDRPGVVSIVFVIRVLRGLAAATQFHAEDEDQDG